ncbi:MAG: hypothetical protein QOD98_3862 [Nocardioidaceae bacterium]|nr:hypothetical protein [Nocardioidaceae bacterium]
MERPLRKFDWSLRSCGARGHITYRPDEPELAEQLRAQTAVGEAWRCLRCEDFVVGPPHGSGPADRAPLVLRGRALKDAVILRLLGTERFVRGLLLVALAYGVYRFDGARDSLQQVFREDLPLLEPLADKLGIDLQDTGPVRLIEKALNAQHSTLLMVAAGVLAYGILQLVEGVGLWLMRRWGEYVAVVGTSAFIPLEVYELVESVTWLRVGALLVNLFAVGYLLWTKRLFGIRGGRRAFEAERHGESLLEVQRAAIDGPRESGRAPRTRPAAH